MHRCFPRPFRYGCPSGVQSQAAHRYTTLQRPTTTSLLPPAQARTQHQLRMRWQSHSQPALRTLSNSHLPAPVQQHTFDPAGSSRVHRARRTRAVFYAIASLALGYSSGALVAHTIAPPPYAEPHTQQDALLISDLDKRIDAEVTVQDLRRQCARGREDYRAAAARNQPGGSVPAHDEAGEYWVEIPASRSVSTTASPSPSGSASRSAPSSDQHHLNAQLAGARALGVERTFVTKRDGSAESISVVWLGGALSGWPGVVHGGAIATILNDKAEFVTRLLMGDHDVWLRGPDAAIASDTNRPSIATATATAAVEDVQIEYKRPTLANAFYVIKAKVLDRDMPEAADAHGSVSGRKSGMVKVGCTLENMAGDTCVRAAMLVDRSISR